MGTFNIIVFLLGIEVLNAVDHRGSVISLPQEHVAKVSSQANDLFTDFWNWRLNNAPEFATFVGEHTYDNRLDEMI